MTELRTAEYDAFGPWVLPVATAEDVPRAFRDHGLELGGSTLVLKIPRDIARRDANPAMHLYDRMLVVDDTTLTVLERDGDGSTATALRTDAVAAVESGSELLEGWLTVWGTDGTRIEIPYNGSSRGIMTSVADRLLGSAPRLEGFVRDDTALDAIGPADIAFANAHRDAARRRDLHVFAAVPGSIPRSGEPLLARVGRRRRRLSGVVVSGNEREIVLFARRSWLRASRKPDLSIRELTIRRDRITAVTIADHPLVAGVSTATLALGSARIELDLRSGSDALEAIRERASVDG